MKFNYFHGKQQRFGITQLGLAITAAFAKLAPKLSTLVGKQLLLNPHGRRRYQFKQIEPRHELNLVTSMGTAHVNLFGSSREVIVLTHGWGDNSYSFERLIQSLTEQGYMVAAVDHIGHGKSTGNKAHLLSFIETMEILLEHFELERIKVSAIVAHSMGAIATLNLPEASLDNKKIVLISSPVQFFDLMFEKVEQVGISRRLLIRVLEQVSGAYGRTWHQLKSENQRNKLEMDVTFVHDLNDRFAPFEHLKQFIQGHDKVITTEGLGHSKILGDTKVIDSITRVLAS